MKKKRFNGWVGIVVVALASACASAQVAAQAAQQSPCQKQLTDLLNQLSHAQAGAGEALLGANQFEQEAERLRFAAQKARVAFDEAAAMEFESKADLLDRNAVASRRAAWALQKASSELLAARVSLSKNCR